MPVNGLGWLVDVRRYTWTLDGSGSHSGIGTGSHGASCLGGVFTTPDVLTEAALVALSGGYDIDAGTNGVTYVGPGAPFGVSYTATGALVIDIDLEADLVYNIGGNWSFSFTLKLYVNGVLKITAPVSGISGGLGPHYLPYGGMCMWGSVSCTAGTTGLPGPLPTTYSYSSSTDATLTMGMSVKEVGSGSFVGFPVSWHGGTAPAVPGGCTDPGLGTVVGSSSDNVVLGVHAEQSAERSESESGTITECCTRTYCCGELYHEDCISQSVPWHRYKTDVQSKSTTAEAGTIPDLERAVNRMQLATSFLAYRTRMPETRYLAAASCDDNGIVTSTTSQPTVHPQQSEILQTWPDSAVAMEDTLGYHAYGQKHVSGGWSRTVTYETVITGGVLCPAAVFCPPPCEDDSFTESVFVGLTDEPPGESYSSSRTYTFPSYVGPSSDCAGYMGHALERPRYINTWCNPHWSYFLWFEDWNVDGAPAARFAYWLWNRQQWHYNPALPMPTRIRNHIVSEPLAYDGDRAFLDTFCGTGLAWLGISRWQTKETVPMVVYDYTADSEPLWSASDGALTFSPAGVIVTP